MRKLLTFITLFGIAAIAVFAYEAYVTRRLGEQMDARIAAIEEAYADIARTAEEQLGGQGGASGEAAADLRAVAEIADEGDLLTRLHGIQSDQRALAAVAERLANEAGDATSNVVAYLREEMGERGTVRAELEAYNISARAWNNRKDGIIGSSLASISGDKPDPLPYLRFDGELEAGQTVQFGT